MVLVFLSVIFPIRTPSRPFFLRLLKKLIPSNFRLRREKGLQDRPKPDFKKLIPSNSRAIEAQKSQKKGLNAAVGGTYLRLLSQNLLA